MSSSTPSAVPLRQDAGIIALVGSAHLVSHFSQLLLAPLFPWLKDAFQVSYTQLGFLMTVFFVVSCAVQATSGFLVDRLGPRPILFVGLGMIGVAALGMAAAPSYGVLALCAAVAGVGNGVFHPVDYTLLNRKVSAPRIGHAYSIHAVTGSLGWGLAPAMLVPLAVAFSWRVALLGAAAFVFSIIAILWWKRAGLALAAESPGLARGTAGGSASSLDFLRIPAVWMCFWFFLCFALVLTVIQTYAPQAARYLHGIPLGLAALCVTVYMLCSAGGSLAGGFLASDPARCERVVASGFGIAAAAALVIGFTDLSGAAVLALFGVMGVASGVAGPSRDLLVKRSTPENASGRVYGVVYSGLDIGQAIAPLLFGALMDRQKFQGVWIALVLLQLLLIFSALQVRGARRTPLVAAS